MFTKLFLKLGGPLSLAIALTGAQVASAQDRAAFNDRAAQARDVIRSLSASNGANEDRARSTPRIVNGQFVIDSLDQGNWEFTASLQHPQANGHFCGGVLVAPTIDQNSSGRFVKVWKRGEDDIRMILTAAHCVTDRNGTLFSQAFFDRLSVDSGMTDIADTKVRQSVKEVFKHPGYDPATNAHDVAVILLNPPENGIPNGATPRSIAMPSVLDVNAYKTTTAGHSVLGWGRTETGFLSQFLQTVLVPYSDQADCAAQYATLGFSVHSSSFCAGFRSGGFDSCQGDSGGPLVYRPTISEASAVLAEPILSGIVSWGEGCGYPGFAGVYADVLQHKAWIESVVLANHDHF